jgi:hypothetical protein
VPQSLFTGAASPTPQQMLWCGPCNYDTTRLCSYTDIDGDGNPDNSPGDVVTPLPVNFRGFDDPQADPTAGLIFVKSTYIKYVRADLYDLPPTYQADDLVTGNPPWGSQPGDGDADGVPDVSALADRHNQGAFAATIRKDRRQREQQWPNDASAAISSPFPPIADPCDVYTIDCGGIAKFSTKAPTGYTPYASSPPPSSVDWPVIPFPRDWAPFKSTDADSLAAIKRLLRFSTSLVSYDSSQPHMSEYSLAEDANNVVVTAPGTPLAGALLDAYHYFVNSVFPQTDDPAINCRNYLIVLLTDGFDEAKSTPCVGGPTGNGPSGDLGAIALPSSPPTARGLAHAADPTIRTNGVPVFVVAMNSAPNDPKLKCIADNSGGAVFAATDRASLVNALQSILEFQRNANVIAAPAIPAFAGGLGDSAQVGAVIPSHTNEDGSASIWSIWNGSLKSFALDVNGAIPVITGTPATPSATPTSGGPTPTPTPTVLLTAPAINTYPDETDPDNATPASRKPVWNAARLLGYTDPVAILANADPAGPAAPAANAPNVKVWPGRKMVWARGSAPTVPLTREEFYPDSAGSPCIGTAVGTCFGDLAVAMGLDATTPADQTTAELTVQFMRGGMTSFGSRDEVLNQPALAPVGPAIGPNAGDQQRYSYFYQDDKPSPGDPQIRTDDALAPKGYSHKLGDIFHSEPTLLDSPKYFQYLAQDLHSYGAFSALNSKRRRVLFVGANDGFLHAFDTGVWNRDSASFPNTFDLGTGREIFAYAPQGVLAEAPKLITFPPRPQYMVDGNIAFADVFIDPAHGGTPLAANRVWKSVVVGTLRQGGPWVYALDVTQPDQIDAVGNKTPGPLDSAPDCLTTGGTCARDYPTIMWELTDNSVPAMGQTWSKPVVGRIKVVNGGAYEDRYVAIFGGGLDPLYNTFDPIVLAGPTATKGRSIYVVDVETGKIIYKASRGTDSALGNVDFAPMPSPPGVVDYDDDGYLDAAYIGDVNGRMWRLDLTADIASSKGVMSAGLITGWTPFLLYDSSRLTLLPGSTNQPIYLEPALIYLAGGARPTLGVAWGSGNRKDLLKIPNASVNRFFYVIDNGGTTTLHEGDLRNITPAGGVTSPGVGPGKSTYGYFLDFASHDEKTTSTVYSTQGYLAVITFTPESNNPCATKGSSYRYRFFFLDGGRGYNLGTATNDVRDYSEALGKGLVSTTQTTTPLGDTDDWLFHPDGGVDRRHTLRNQRTINQNWKEQ